VAAQPIPSESTTTTTTTTKYRPPQPGLLSNVHLSTDAAVIGILAGLAYLFTLRRPVTTAPAATGTAPTSAASIAATTGVTSPPPSPPGAPAELYELGATAHSVLVACSPVTGAVAYEWREYGTDLILARSPTNVALIEGLQANTMYQVYCVAIGYDGQPGPPSAPLLVSTTQSGPVVYVGQPQQVQVVLQMLTTPGAAPNAATSTAPQAQTTPPTVTVSAPSSATVGQTVTVTATVSPVPSGATVQWTWQATGPAGTLPGATHSNGATDTYPLTVSTVGSYTVTVTATVNGQTVSGQATIQGVPPTAVEGLATPTDNVGRPNAPSAVIVTAPSTGTVGQPITIQAQAAGVPAPMYQFWVAPPAGGSIAGVETLGGYTLVQGYSRNNVATFTPNAAGTWTVVVYARAGNAPTNETDAERAIWETRSHRVFIAVQAAPVSASSPAATTSAQNPSAASSTPSALQQAEQAAASSTYQQFVRQVAETGAGETASTALPVSAVPQAVFTAAPVTHYLPVITGSLAAEQVKAVVPYHPGLGVFSVEGQQYYYDSSGVLHYLNGAVVPGQ
jgi:hypothetical protein